MCMIEKVAYMQKHTSETSPYSDLGPWGEGGGGGGGGGVLHPLCNFQSL